MFLNGNFVALPEFQKRYGVEQADGKFAIETKWQSSLFQAGQCGAFVGVFLAGPITTRLGYRWTTILALILMNATIFISFFVSTSRLVPLLTGSLADHRSTGGFARSTRNQPSFRRHTLGFLHCKLPGLCQRSGAYGPPWSLHRDPSDELVYWWHHCRRRHIRLQPVSKRMGLASTSCSPVDLPRE